MTCDEYKAAVIDLFRAGRATEAQWQEIAECVLWASEGSADAVAAIDAVVKPNRDKGD